MKAALSFVWLAGGMLVWSCQIYTEDLLRTSPLAASGASSMPNAGTGSMPSALGGSAAVPAVPTGGATSGAGGSSAAEAGVSGRIESDGGARAMAGSASLSGTPEAGDSAVLADTGGTAPASGASGTAGESGDASASPACVVAADCDDGNPCTTDACDASGACSFVAGNPGAVCRPATGSCDVADKCTGSSVTCPADAVVINGTACDDGNTSTCNDACSAEVCGGSKDCTPCSGICAKPLNIDNTSNPNTSSALCDERTNASGANAGGVAGKGFEVNGHAVTSDGTVSPWPAKRFGGYCFKSSAPLGWLALY